MRLRTKEDVEDVISAELSWRKKELSVLKLLIDRSHSKGGRVQPMIRSAVLVLYAHWEGFVKVAGSAYVDYVNNKNLELRQLASPFQALAIRKELRIPLREARQEHLVAIVDFMLNKESERCPLASSQAVVTESNLDSKVLQRIMLVLGLDFSPFETKQVLIDDVLVHYRNNIAHGKDLEMDYPRFEALYWEVIGFLQIFGNQISNAVNTAAYRMKT